MGSGEPENKDVVITFETLFELLRQEKNKEELQKLDYTFLLDAAAYIREKKRAIEHSQKTLDVFSIEEREKSEKQLQNILKIVKELYDRREKKIVHMSINRARLGMNIVDTSNLLAEERGLFESLVSTLDNYRRMILGNVLSPPSQCFDNKPDNDKTNIINNDNNNKNETSAQLPPADTKMVRFLTAVPKFVGLDLEIYGPFAEDDIANLPTEMADVLIEKGRAEELNRQEKAI